MSTPHYQLYINGSWKEGSEGQVMQSINPATGEAVGNLRLRIQIRCERGGGRGKIVTL